MYAKTYYFEPRNLDEVLREFCVTVLYNKKSRRGFRSEIDNLSLDFSFQLYRQTCNLRCLSGGYGSQRVPWVPGVLYSKGNNYLRVKDNRLIDLLAHLPECLIHSADLSDVDDIDLVQL